MRLQPEVLQLGVVVRREVVVLQYLVELLELASMEGDERLRLEHRLILVEEFAGGQRPEKARQSLDVAALLEHLAHAGHLLLGEAERRVAGHGHVARAAAQREPARAVAHQSGQHAAPAGRAPLNRMSVT